MRTDQAAPIRSRFVAQDHMPSCARELDVSSLSPYHRCLLVTDGSVSSLVEARTLEPIRTKCVGQAERELAAWEARWLGLPATATAIARRVLIEGAASGAAQLSATSILVPSRLPASFLDRLRDNSEAGVGAALIGSEVESRRELLWCSGSPNGIAARTYRIFIGGQPAALISEEFLQ